MAGLVKTGRTLSNRRTMMRSPGLFNKDTLIRNIEAQHFDAVVAASPPNVIYTSGVDLYTQTLIPERLVLNLIGADGGSSLIAFARERAQIERDSWVRDVRLFAEFGQSPIAILADLLREKGLAAGRVGIEKRYLPVGFYEELKSLLPQCRLADCETVFALARMTKTQEEIDLMRVSSRALDKAIWLAAQLARPGDTERAVARQIVSNLMTLVEGEAREPEGIVACGPNLMVSHHTSSDTRMSQGEMVRYGCKARCDGYWFIILRMAAAGCATPQQLSKYAKYAAVFHGILHQLRPGIPARAPFVQCREALAKEGLQLVSEKIGHSTGLVFREAPILQESEEMELRADMVLAYDFLALDQAGAPYHIEDRVLITQDGCELLSNVCDTKALLALHP
jgi:Xaa-Pro aminopeptidase